MKRLLTALISIAAQIMQERGIPTNDLYGLVEPHANFFSGGRR